MTTVQFHWRCDPVQPNVPGAPVPPVTRWYRSELPPVDADEHARVCAERDAMTIDWQAIGAELQRIAPDGVNIDYTPVHRAPTWASESAAWFVGDGDIEAFGATLEAAMTEFMCLRAEAVQP